MKKEYTVAAYYFPQWHHDPQHEELLGKSRDWSEWDVLKHAVPRFPGHNQPKVPVWGYLDESDPKTSEIQINAAADHGIDVFIYDWYWDMNGEDTGKFLHSALEKGFLKAKNRSRMKFGLMLCNHRELSRERWELLTDYVIENYFHLPEYWEVDGGKYFSLYELSTFVKGLGGMQQAAEAIESFRKKAAAKGYKLHINFVEWGLQNEALTGSDKNKAVEICKGDSVTSYVWIHNFVPKAPLYAPYADGRDGAGPYWEKFRNTFSVEYYPNVSMGWDSSGRFDPQEEYVADPNGGYYCTIMSENTPEEFEKALQMSKDFLDAGKNRNKIVTLYAWNEWTEGGYLEPEKKYGYGYLEAIKKVFGTK